MNPLSCRHTRLNQLAEEYPGLTYEDILKMESLMRPPLCWDDSVESKAASRKTEGGNQRDK